MQCNYIHTHSPAWLSLKGPFLMTLEKMEFPFLATDVQSVSSSLLLPVNNYSSLRRRSIGVWAGAIPALIAVTADTPHCIAESWFPRLITTFIIDKLTRNHFIVSIIQWSDCISVSLPFALTNLMVQEHKLSYNEASPTTYSPHYMLTHTHIHTHIIDTVHSKVVPLKPLTWRVFH